jgi:hypothetical protein
MTADKRKEAQDVSDLLVKRAHGNASSGCRFVQTVCSGAPLAATIKRVYLGCRRSSQE